MANKSEVEYFRDPNKPFSDLAHMLIELDDSGLLPVGMRQAIRRHANSTMDTLPLSIAATAHSLASASIGGGGLDALNVANSSYAIAALAEQMHAWTELAYSFGPENVNGEMEVSNG